MKTVQEWLWELDEERLIGYFLAAKPIDFEMLENKKHTVETVFTVAKQQIRIFIHQLKQVNAIKSEQYIFFAVKMIKDGYEKVGVELSDLEDILNIDLPDHFDWITDYEKVMGYLVADTELALARNNIYEVMADILAELSFFGFTRERMEAGRKKLDATLLQTEASIKEGTRHYSLEEFRERMYKTLGLKPEKKDEQAERLRSEVRMAECKFYEYCRKREILQVRELIQTERHEL